MKKDGKGSVCVAIIPGHALGMYEYPRGFVVDPGADAHTKISEEELQELERLRAARDAYYALCWRLKKREVSPGGGAL